MSRRVRTEAGKRRARARFMDNNAERIRLTLVAGGMVILASAIAKAALG